MTINLGTVFIMWQRRLDAEEVWHRPEERARVTRLRNVRMGRGIVGRPRKLQDIAAQIWKNPRYS